MLINYDQLYIDEGLTFRVKVTLKIDEENVGLKTNLPQSGGDFISCYRNKRELVIF